MKLHVVPAYGRDYKSQKAVLDDWNAGKDFLICNMFDPHDGLPVNRADALKAGYTDIQFRFGQLRKVFVTKGV